MSKFRSLLAAVSILLCAATLPVNGGLPKRHPAIAGYFLFQQDIPAKAVVLKGQGSTPANPSAGWYKLFVDSTGALKLLDSSGGVTTFGAGGGGFELQTETSFTDNSTPAIFLKSPADNNTAFLRLVDSADATLAEVDSSGVGRFYSVEFPDGSDGIVNAISNMLRLQSDGFGWAVDSTGALRLESADASVAGIPKSVIHLPVLPSHSGITASTEYKAFWSNNSPTYTWATGALTTNRFFHLTAPTMAFAGSSTVTTAATLAISGSPIAGSNATITNSRALWVESGVSQFDGNVSLGSSNVLLLAGATSPGTATKFQLGTPTTADNAVNIHIEPTSTSTTALAIQANASQSVDLIKYRNSAGTVVGGIASTGQPYWSNGLGGVVGYGGALNTTTTALNVVAIGLQAGEGLTNGGTNILIGSEAGRGLTTGSANVFIGYQAVNWDTAIANSVVIGSEAFDQGAVSYTGTGPVLAIGQKSGADLTTQNNIAVFGSSTSPLNDWYFGESYSTASPSDITFQPSVASGTNIAGSSFYLRSGAGTGNATPGKLYLQYASAGSSGATVQSYTTAVTIDSTATDVTGLLQVDRIAGTTSAPSISAGAAAGTTPTVSVTGTDLAGEIVITTGTGSVGSGTLATITLNTAFANDCYPVLQAADADSRAVAISITHSSTGFTIVAGAAGWNTSTEYRWTYIVAGR